MAQTSILTIMIQLAKKGDADRSTIKGLAELKNNATLAMGAFSAFAGVALGVGAALGKTITAFTSYATQVRDISRLTGMSAEETSKLIQAADDVTISYESLQKALWAASKQGLEVSIESISSMAGEYNSLGSAAEQAAFLSEKFGKSGAEMGKLLEQGESGIKRMTNAMSGSLILTEQSLQAAREYEISVDNLNDSWDGLMVTLGGEAVPVLTDVLDLANQLFTSISRPNPGGWLAGVIENSRGNKNEIDSGTQSYIAWGQAAEAAASTAAAAEADLLAQSREASAENQNRVSLMMNMQAEATSYAQKQDELTLKIDELEAKQSKYWEGGRKWKEIQGEIDQTKLSVEQLAAEHEAASKQIAFSLLQQKLAVDGLTDAEFNSLMAIGVQWGVVDEQVAASALNMDAQATAMAESLGQPNNELMSIIEKINNLARKSGSSFSFFVKLHVSGSVPSYLTSAAGTGGMCFLAGTLITMADGSSKPIEEIAIGDPVRSYDLASRTYQPARVSQLIRHESRDHLSIDDIHVTTEHPFWVENKQEWIKAGDLQPGDVLLQDNGTTRTIRSIVRVEQEAPVYNLEVEGLHNYFASGVLVHNKTTGDDDRSGTANAEGGPLGSGWTLVGERGPELVSPAGWVFSNRASQELIASGVAPSQYRMFGGAMDVQEARAAAAGNLDTRRAARKARSVAPAVTGTKSDTGPSTGAVMETVSTATEVSAAAAQSSVVAQQQANIQATETRKTIQEGNDSILGALRENNELLRQQMATMQRSIVAAVQQAAP